MWAMTNETCENNCACVAWAVPPHYPHVKQDRCLYVLTMTRFGDYMWVIQELTPHQSHDGGGVSNSRVSSVSCKDNASQLMLDKWEDLAKLAQLTWHIHSAQVTTRPHTTIFSNRNCLSPLLWNLGFCMMLAQYTHLWWKYISLMWG